MKSRPGIPRRSLLLSLFAVVPGVALLDGQIKLPNPLGKKPPEGKDAEALSQAQSVIFLGWSIPDPAMRVRETGAAFSYRMADATTNTANGITVIEMRGSKGQVLLSIEVNRDGNGSYKLVDNSGKPVVQPFDRTSFPIATLDENGGMTPGARGKLAQNIIMLKMNVEDTQALLPELETPLRPGHIVVSLPPDLAVPTPAEEQAPDKEEPEKKGGFLRRRLDDAKKLKDKAAATAAKKMGKGGDDPIRSIPRHSFAGR